MIPLNALLTPYTPVQPPPPNQFANALSGLGDFLQNRNEVSANQDFRERQMAQQGEIQRGQLAEQGRYHDIIGGMRKDALKDKQEAKDEKLANSLFDMLHKAERSGDENGMKLVHDRLKQMGYDVQTGDTATYVPKPAAEPEAKAPKPPVPPEMAKYAGGMAGGLTGSLSPTTYASTDEEGFQVPPGTPPELAALAPASAPKVPSTPEAPKGPGGKYSIFKEGVLVHEYDAPLEKQRIREQILSVNAPFTQGGSKDQQEDAKIAADYAGNLSGLPGMTPEKTNEAFLRAYKELGDRRKKEGVGGTGGAPGGGLSKAEIGQETAVEDRVQKIIDRTASRDVFAQINKDTAAVEQGMTLINQPSGFAQTAGLLEFIKNLNGRAPAEREFSAFKHSDGLLRSLETKANWFFENNAPLSPAFVETLRQAMMASAIELKARRQSAARDASEQVLHSKVPFSSDEDREQQADRAAGAFSGEYKVQGPSRTKKPSGGGAKPAPSGGETAEQKRARLLKLVGQ